MILNLKENKMEEFNEDKLIELINNFMSTLNEHHIGGILFLRSYDFMSGVVNVPSMEFWEPLTELFNQALERRMEAQDEDPSYLSCYLMAQVILSHLDDMNFKTLMKKYNKFKNGDTEGLTDEEINSFIKIAVREKHKKIVKATVNGHEVKFKIISNLTESEKLNIYHSILSNICDNIIQCTISRSFNDMAIIVQDINELDIHVDSTVELIWENQETLQ